MRWSETRKAALAAGQLLRRELDALGASADLGSCGHIDSTVLLASGLWPEGDEMGRSLPDNHWVLHEELKWWRLPGESHVLRWRLELPFRTFLLSERVRSPK